MLKRIIAYLIVIAVVVLFVLYSNFGLLRDRQELAYMPTDPIFGEPYSPAFTVKPRVFSAWVIYWDQLTAVQELLALGDRLEAVSHFSVVFDEAGNMRIPAETLSLHRLLREEPLPSAPLHFLTLVNDVMFDDGRPSLLKDKNLLELLFATPESRARHIAGILYLIELHGFDAVELDYETMHRREGLAEKFAEFCFELWAALEPLDIPLRIVLEPSFPADRIALPKGPEYAVMFYNLFGPGTGPGPKADAAFIKQTQENMRVLPTDNLIIAFATGGFVWTEGLSAVQAVSEVQAWEWLESSGAAPQRDAASGALYYSYTNAEGQKRTLWFADGYTLDFWMRVAQEDGVTYRFAIWRLSQNRLASLEILKN